ncbi:hypothetical protein DRB17_03005 [Ferruginivarius sediminum]|uniref:Antifreeze protein n=1 Tax=Ferruginivarius sediminum TaxID=2661937 RepID=A0A369TKI1_9PROT|nr:hypothetical protein DRB17_03005 [Ferruginivarius sediminum]
MRASIAAAALVLCLVPGMAAAQDDVGEPLRLAPLDPEPAGEASSGGAADSEAVSSGEPDTADPEESAPERRSAKEKPSSSRDIEGIEVDRLDELTTGSVGVLDQGAGGFRADMWAGTPRGVVEALIPRIPADIGSHSLRALARRLLLSSAAPPHRQQAAQAGEDNLLKLRAERLAALGETGGLIDLLRVAPQRFSDAELTRLHVEALLLAHQRDRACNKVRDAVGEYDAVFWQKAMAVCQIHAGHIGQASLTVSLLREVGRDTDVPFFAVFSAVEQGAGSAPVVEAPGPMQLALMFAGGLPVAKESLAGMEVAGLMSVAAHEGTSAEVRAVAAELAAARGALAAERLRPIYMRFEFQEARLRNAASLNGPAADENMTPVRRRALLYQAARSDPAAAVRAELVREALNSADGGLYLPLARLFAPILADIEVKPELAWFAATAGRALYAANRAEAANRWLMMARQEAIINPEAAAAVTMLWPYARLSGGGEVPVNGGLAAWRSTQVGGDDGVAARESLLQTAFQAFGTRESRSWAEIAAEGPGDTRAAPPAALLFALQEAGEGGRLGEAVLLSVMALGGTGISDCHPVALGMALKALNQVGLEEEARRLAIEAVVAGGI